MAIPRVESEGAQPVGRAARSQPPVGSALAVGVPACSYRPAQRHVTGSRRVARRAGRTSEDRSHRDRTVASGGADRPGRRERPGTTGKRCRPGARSSTPADQQQAHQPTHAGRDHAWPRSGRPPRICERPTRQTAFGAARSRAVRSETDTSITFMIPMPATESEIAAMPPSAMVNAVRIEESEETTDSCVMQVTSSSSWRSVMISTAREQFRHLDDRRARPVLIRIRKSEVRLKIRIAVASGMNATSSRSIPTCVPDESSTPMTRIRQSPMRTTRPSALSPRKSSLTSVAPSTTCGPPRCISPGGRKRPWTTRSRRVSR